MLKSADKLYVFFLLLELARLLLELARLSFYRKVSFVPSRVPYLSGPQVIN